MLQFLLHINSTLFHTLFDAGNSCLLSTYLIMFIYKIRCTTLCIVIIKQHDCVWAIVLRIIKYCHLGYSSYLSGFKCNKICLEDLN